LTGYTSLPYSGESVVAEIVSLSGYEAQVSALVNEEERMAMEFFIASVARLAGPDEARGKAAAYGLFISS